MVYESNNNYRAGWAWGKPSYFTSQLFGSAVRIAYWDLSDNNKEFTGETVLLTHGEPSWSFLNRKLVGPLLKQGHRVVLFDQVKLSTQERICSFDVY